MNKINQATFFLLKSEKKTDEGHLKQMRECLRNFCFWPKVNIFHLKNWLTLCMLGNFSHIVVVYCLFSK